MPKENPEPVKVYKIGGQYFHIAQIQNRYPDGSVGDMELELPLSPSVAVNSDLKEKDPLKAKLAEMELKNPSRSERYLSVLEYRIGVDFMTNQPTYRFRSLSPNERAKFGTFRFRSLSPNERAKFGTFDYSFRGMPGKEELPDLSTDDNVVSYMAHELSYSENKMRAELSKHGILDKEGNIDFSKLGEWFRDAEILVSPDAPVLSRS